MAKRAKKARSVAARCPKARRSRVSGVPVDMAQKEPRIGNWLRGGRGQLPSRSQPNSRRAPCISSRKTPHRPPNAPVPLKTGCQAGQPLCFCYPGNQRSRWRWLCFRRIDYLWLYPHSAHRISGNNVAQGNLGSDRRRVIAHPVLHVDGTLVFSGLGNTPRSRLQSQRDKSESHPRSHDRYVVSEKGM